MEPVYGIRFKEDDPFIDAKKKLIERLFYSPYVKTLEAKRVISASAKRDITAIERLEHELSKLDEGFVFPSLQEHRAGFLDFVKRKIKEWIEFIGPLVEKEIQGVIERFEIDKIAPDLVYELGLYKQSEWSSPIAIKNRLDQTVIGQETAKKTLSFVFYLHLLRTKRIKPSILNFQDKEVDIDHTELPKPNILLCGPTGSGKTFIIKTLCEMFSIPFVKVDCASLVSSGYTGSNIDSSFRKLVAKAGNKKNAANGIIYFDEFDKLSEYAYSRGGGSVGGVELQQEFLATVESQEKTIRNRRYSSETTQIKTNNILYVFSGSFSGIEKIIQKRLGMSSGVTMGFSPHRIKVESSEKSNSTNDDFLSQLQAEDVIGYGIIPELVGRLNYFVPLHALGKEDIIRIMLESDQSPLKLYENFFKVHLDRLEIEEDVLPLIAEKVISMGGGGRAITSVLQQLLNEFLFQCPNDQMEIYVLDKAYFYSKFPKGK